MTAMGLTPELASIIRCPECLGELAQTSTDGSDRLDCGQCLLSYPMRNSIPILLVDEARLLSEQPSTSE